MFSGSALQICVISNWLSAKSTQPDSRKWHSLSSTPRLKMTRFAGTLYRRKCGSRSAMADSESSSKGMNCCTCSAVNVDLVLSVIATFINYVLLYLLLVKSCTFALRFEKHQRLR